jgi:hypothetical protein
MPELKKRRIRVSGTSGRRVGVRKIIFKVQIIPVKKWRWGKEFWRDHAPFSKVQKIELHEKHCLHKLILQSISQRGINKLLNAERSFPNKV